MLKIMMNIKNMQILQVLHLAAGAKILSRGGRIKNLEGEEMNRIVVIEFPSMEQAESFYHSDEYRKGLKYINSEVADRFLNIAEAVD